MPKFLEVTSTPNARAALGVTAVGDGVVTAATEVAARAALDVQNFNGYAVPAIDIVGDSITSQNGGSFPESPPSGSTYPSESDYQARGYLSHALIYLGHRLRVGTNFGIGGQTTTQIYARISDVIVSPNRFVHVYAGINDVAQGVSAENIETNLASIYQELIAADKIVSTATIGTTLSIGGSALLAGISAGASSFTAPAGATAGDTLTLGAAGNTESVVVASVSGGPATYTIALESPTTLSHSTGDPFVNVTKLATLHAVNQWIVDYCQGRYVDASTSSVVVNSGKSPYLVDWYNLVADQSGQPLQCLESDGSITTVSDDALVTLVDGTHPGQDLAHRMGNALARVLDRVVPPLPIQGGGNSEAANLLPNGRCVGNDTGLATGFTLNAASGTIVAAASKISRTDGIPGEMQQVAIGPGNTGEVQLVLGSVTGLTFTGTDYYTAEVEFETDPNLVATGGAGVPLKTILLVMQDSTLLQSATCPFNASGQDGGGSIWPDRGVLKTKPLLATAAANRIILVVQATCVDTGTFRIKSARVRKVI